MTDERLEIFIGNLLRLGVLVSAIIVAAGGALYLAQHGREVVNYQTFRSELPELRNLVGICTSAFHLRSDGIIQLGLVLLIATPIARVALAVVGFYLEGDRLYVVVSLTVLAILAYSIMHAA
jgi:uncharacterized membrane protein